jgi:hypothetical protein
MKFGQGWLGDGPERVCAGETHPTDGDTEVTQTRSSYARRQIVHDHGGKMVIVDVQVDRCQ